MIATGTIARYISKRFLQSILTVFLVCLLIIFLVDFIELLRRAGKYGSIPALTLVWLTLLRLPSYAELTLPFSVLAGSIGAFLLLSRKSELIVIRAAGMSVWQFMLPGILVAAIFGAIAVMLYNPMAAISKSKSERLYAAAFGKKTSLLKTKRAGAWLRQDSVDGQSVIHAKGTANHGMLLSSVTIFQFDRDKRFVERIDANKAELKNGHWELQDALVSSSDRRPERYDRYILSTYLSPTQVKDALGSVESISFWDLPNFIDIAEKAGLPATRYKVQYQMLLSRPILLIAMVLVAATCSLRAFRSGNIQTLIVTGLGSGLAFFMFAEVSRKIGLSGIASPATSAWIPVIVAGALAMTVLLHQEDG